MGEILFPMTCNILTPGHIMCLVELSKMGHVIVGLLTPKALRGYKEEITPFADRKFILETVAKSIGNIAVVPQDSLDPSDTIKQYKCTALASGDGFEEIELSAIFDFNLSKIDIILPGEKTKRYSSSKLLERSSL